MKSMAVIAAISTATAVALFLASWKLGASYIGGSVAIIALMFATPED